MLVELGDGLLQTADSQEEMQIYLDLVRIAWNMALEPPARSKTELKRFIKKQRRYAPSVKGLKALEGERRRMVERKRHLFPDIDKEALFAQAIHVDGGDYTIRAYFDPGEQA